MTMDTRKTVKASEFKAKCLQLMDDVAKTGESLLITKRGRPVAELRPARLRPSTLFGAHRGQIEIKGDIVAPLDLEWEAEG